MYKLVISIFFLLCCSAMLAACTQNYDDLVNEVVSTDLSKEQLDNVKLGIVTEDLEKQGFEYGEDNASYEDIRGYDRYRGKKLYIDIDRESKKIVGVLTNDEINYKNIATTKGIKIHNDIKKVKELYGSNYYTYSDEEQGLEEIGFVDRKNDIKLTFTSNEKGKVISIRLSVYNKEYE